MKEPAICLYVQDDVVQPLRWILKEFNKDFHVTTFHSPALFEDALRSQEWDLLVLDYPDSGQSIVSQLSKLRSEKPGLKIILIVPPVGSKEIVMEIIQAKMVNGLVVKPFTAEVVCSYVAREFGGTADPGPQKVRSKE